MSAASLSVTVTGTAPPLVKSSSYPATEWLTEVMPCAPSSSSRAVTVTSCPRFQFAALNESAPDTVATPTSALLGVTLTVPGGIVASLTS